MNISVYLFGDFGSGYTQYPNDYTHTIFETFHKNTKATTQIVIHRENELMYYGYIRKLEDGGYIGICAIINGLMITKFDSLFSIFERIIESMVMDEYLIHFNDNGEIISKIGLLYENKEEIDLIITNLQTSFNSLESVSEQLPPVNYSISKDSVKSFSIQDDEAEIVKSSYTFGYTVIYKSEEANRYKVALAKKDDEIAKLKDSISNLEDKISELKKDMETQEHSFRTIISIKDEKISKLSNSSENMSFDRLIYLVLFICGVLFILFKAMS